jgi:membrane protein
LINRLLNMEGLTLRELAWNTWDHVLTEHAIFKQANSIAYCAMMAFVPFLALIISAFVQFLPDLSGNAQATGFLNLTVDQFEATLKVIFPNEAYKIVVDQIARLQAMPPLLVIPLSLVLTLWRASSLFREIIDALNRINDSRESRPFWKVWLVSFFMTVVQAVIVFLAMVAIVGWPQIMALLGLKSQEASLIGAVKWLVLFVMILLSFAMMFHAGPGAVLKHKWVTPGTLFGTVAFLAATSLLRVYLQNFASYENAYGTLGGVFVLLFWFWITSFVLLIAAEMNRIAQYASQKREEFDQLQAGSDAAVQAPTVPILPNPAMTADNRPATKPPDGSAAFGDRQYLDRYIVICLVYPPETKPDGDEQTPAGQ